MSRYVLYLDDSKIEPKGESRILCWAGYIIKQDDELQLIEGLDLIKNKVGLNRYDPIKWSPDSNTNKYKAQREQVVDANNFKKDVLSHIANSPVTLLGGIIEQNRKIKFENMAQQLISDISSRFQFFIQDEIEREKSDINSSGLIVLSYPSNKECKTFSDHYHEIHQGQAVITTRSPYSQNGIRKVMLNNLELGLYFSYEAHNPYLQLADFIASCCAYTIKNKKGVFFDIIRSKFRQRNGYIKGVGLTVYPSNSNVVDILLSKFDSK